MTVVFIATSFAQARWAWLAYVRAFAEAGMVGACADWFAVVALFRHPLGIPIPHTAIVPQQQGAHRRRAWDASSPTTSSPRRCCRNGWPRSMPRIGSPIGSAAPTMPRRVARNAALAIPEVVRALPREQIADVLGRPSCAGLEAMPAAPVAANLLAIVWAQGQTQKLIERGSNCAKPRCSTTRTSSAPGSRRTRRAGFRAGSTASSPTRSSPR